MSDVVIRAQGLGKRYQIGRIRHRQTLKQAMLGAALEPARRLRSVLRGQSASAQTEHFWALRDVSFEVKRGEVVGVIGSNGAGKSTLLKVLSRITAPTTGMAEIHGRVGSLLEVGTGFHPELTGRENMFLNGAILGMRREAVERDFDEIVSFAEVAKFIDTPVKYYSSGMYLRLAFAVAAFMEPEILLVDEVLAVGDARFQKKCLGKMRDISRMGRTVFFVSHNLDAVRQLCTRGILIAEGSVRADGAVDEVLDAYADLLGGTLSIGDVGLQNRLNRTNGAVRFTEVSAVNPTGDETWRFEEGQSIRFRVVVEVFQDVPSLGLYLMLRSGVTSEPVTTFKHEITESPARIGDRFVVTLEIPDAPLRPGTYSVYACVGNATCEVQWDVIDDNVNLPPLQVWSDDKDIQRRAGFFSTPSRLTVNSMHASDTSHSKREQS
jgi:lipopolysaccharide transport system ATP-binding protein